MTHLKTVIIIIIIIIINIIIIISANTIKDIMSNVIYTVQAHHCLHSMSSNSRYKFSMKSSWVSSECRGHREELQLCIF
jgi:hypothetical protein